MAATPFDIGMVGLGVMGRNGVCFSIWPITVMRRRRFDTDGAKVVAPQDGRPARRVEATTDPKAFTGLFKIATGHRIAGPGR